MDKDIRSQLLNLIEPLMKDLSCELVEMNINNHSNGTHVEIYADKISGGISLDECVHLNRALAEKLEEDPLFAENFSFEVSSPGLDRSLRTAKDFRRVLDKDVRFHLTELIAHKLEHVGTVKEVDNSCVTIQTKVDDILIPLKVINKAVQVI